MLPKGHLLPDHAAMLCMDDHQTGLMLGGRQRHVASVGQH